MMYAPVIVFGYNRADHILETLNALSGNPEAKETELYVFIDGPKKDNEKVRTDAVYACVQQNYDSVFKKVNIVYAKANKGLAQSIITGVTSVIEKSGKVVVLEDDSVPTPNFLHFVNEALECYEGDSRIGSIGGFTAAFNFPKEYDQDIILTQRPSSCAWATWRDRWEIVDWKVSDYNRFRYDFLLRRHFNRWGEDRATMLDDQMVRNINSWAIRFDYSLFKKNMYTVLPKKSLIRNIGFDGTGVHSRSVEGKENIFQVIPDDTFSPIIKQDIKVDERVRHIFRNAYHVPLAFRIKRYCANLVYRR